MKTAQQWARILAERLSDKLLEEFRTYLKAHSASSLYMELMAVGMKRSAEEEYDHRMHDPMFRDGFTAACAIRDRSADDMYRRGCRDGIGSVIEYVSDTLGNDEVTQKLADRFEGEY